MSDTVKLTVNGVPVTVPAGAMVSTAVALAGVTAFRRSVTGEPRAPALRHGDLFRVPRDHRRPRALPQLPGHLRARHGGANR